MCAERKTIKASQETLKGCSQTKYAGRKFPINFPLLYSK